VSARAGRLAGKRALVTGASSGIGEAAARAFVREGAHVVLAARTPGPLEEVARKLGEAATAHPADVSDPLQVAELVDETVRLLGGLDVVVHSAGISKPAPLEELTAERWREVIDVNLSGCFYVCREAGLRMRELGGGVIVNVASESSILGEPAYVAYCASKGGVLTLTRALAAELAPTVRVNAVCPGSVDTPMLRRDFASLPDPEYAMQATAHRIALGRFAQPDEVAAAIVFLAAEATFATGCGLALDGGTTATLPAMVSGAGSG
jgi:NAD(P)-dependent dehydrogenase (short-subunit alcohol dehydrogenase family)